MAKAKLTSIQYHHNAAAASRQRQQEHLIKQWAYSKKIMQVESETAQAIITINDTLKNYHTSDTEFKQLLALKTQAQKKFNHRLNVEIFKTCRAIKRRYRLEQRQKKKENKQLYNSVKNIGCNIDG